VPHGRGSLPLRRGSLRSVEVPSGAITPPNPLGGAVQDLLYIGLVIVVFAALWLLVKGVERFER